MRQRGALLVALSLLALTGIAAQSPSEPRLDSATASAVQRIVDSAAAAGLPVEALRAKALEGAGRGVSSERIVMAVQAFARRLSIARTILAATDASEAELVAVAGTLTAGVSTSAAESLARTVNAEPRAPPLTVAFVVVADLAARGVPADSAASVVRMLILARRSEADLWALRAAVARDIAGGGAPLEALTTRSHGGAAPVAAPARDASRPPKGSP